MSKSLPLALAAALALAGAAHAQGAAQSGVYVIEPNHTEVLFGISHLGFSTYYGQFPGASGSLTLDAANPAASQLDVTVPIAGVMTASPKLNDELKGPQWFDAAQFPVMTFHSTKIVSTGPTSADVIGDLTIHGITHREVLKVTLNRAAPNPMMKTYSAGFEVSGHIKRSDFGVSAYVPMIGDDVNLIISAAFNRKPA
jgi:polyisoprenoid-binding protein YceI